jgi:hypothetical protein
MPLSWNEIKSRAMAFSREWMDAADEASQAKPFWIDGTDRKFNRMRPSMARVFGFETRRPRQTKAD